ncbi:TULIP family P47-like protein [Starkeya koreensis]|uniref:TULIP family P47-like protein n=1 Tax=Ancylobacter koreensis TaxID=266121 RepID=A0ABT0DN18_9HYPH|nr:TULIP family P47-like protein [Ancylobacter koreensis]MCK0208668.1 TULIP family P47-like protein [Ancylobacter koreensis]
MTASTYGWDVVYAVRLPEINAQIRALAPEQMTMVMKGMDVSATLAGWSIVPGGSGSLLNAELRLENGVVRQGADIRPFSGIARLTVRLSTLNYSNVFGPIASHLELRVTEAEKIAFIDSLRLGEKEGDLANIVLVALRLWLDAHPEALAHVFARVDVVDAGYAASDSWLKPTAVSFAYHDAPEIEDCLVAILSMVDGRDPGHLDHNVAPDAVPANATSAILISRQIFLDAIIRPSLPRAFPGARIGDFFVSEDHSEIRLKEPRALDTRVTVGGSQFQPLLTLMEVGLRGDVLSCRTHCQIGREGEFTAYAEYSCTYRLCIEKEPNGDGYISFGNKQEVLVRNWMEVAPEYREKGKIASYVAVGVGTLFGILTGGVGGIVIFVASEMIGQMMEHAGDIVEYYNGIPAPSLDLFALHVAIPYTWTDRRIFDADTLDIDKSVRFAGVLRSSVDLPPALPGMGAFAAGWQR